MYSLMAELATARQQCRDFELYFWIGRNNTLTSGCDLLPGTQKPNCFQCLTTSYGARAVDVDLTYIT